MISAAARAPELARQAGAMLKRTARVHIPDFLEEAFAQELLAALQNADWWLMFMNGDAVVEANLQEFSALDAQKRAAVIQGVHEQAALRFQYLYDVRRISEAPAAGQALDPALARLHTSLNAPETLDFFRALTGDPRIAGVDSQATRYRQRHFLTMHEDRHESVSRLYAYVLNLTPHWRADWGGVLTFIDEDGHICEGFTPAWNAINIFKVPQRHAVSVVAPFARGARYSITGWMRAEPI